MKEYMYVLIGGRGGVERDRKRVLLLVNIEGNG